MSHFYQHYFLWVFPDDHTILHLRLAYRPLVAADLQIELKPTLQ
jgi:hypothetical protein